MTDALVPATATSGIRPAPPAPKPTAAPTRNSQLSSALPDRMAPPPAANDALATSPGATADTVPDAAASDGTAPSDAQAPSFIAATAPVSPDYDELTVRTDSVIGIRLDTAVSSETAHVEDRVTARVSRDVLVDGRVAVPAGSTLEGIVTTVQRGGRFKERARLGVRFTSVLLADNERVPIQTETIFRIGDAPTGEASAKIGGAAVLGAILGSVIGGKKGAAIGSTAGAAGGTAAVMAGDVNSAVIPASAPLTVRLTGPATVLVEHQP